MVALILNRQPLQSWSLWHPMPEVDLAGYQIYYDFGQSGPPYEGIATIFGYPSPVTVGLDIMRQLTVMFNDSTYFVTVSAYDIEGNENGYSKEGIIAPGLPILQDINDLTIVRSGNNITLTWSPVTTDTSVNHIEVTSYVVFVSPDDPYFIPTSLDSIGAVTPPDTTFLDYDAITNPIRFYNVKTVVEN